MARCAVALWTVFSDFGDFRDLDAILVEEGIDSIEGRRARHAEITSGSRPRARVVWPDVRLTFARSVMSISILQLGRILFQPNRVIGQLADAEISAGRIFFGLTLWLVLIPPVCAFIGTMRFGWLLGVEPLLLSAPVAFTVSLAYLAMLLVGFFSTTLISRWMASTYGAADSLGRNFALITIVGAPLAAGGIVHLYPHAFVNVLVLVPVLIWSLYLLYRGLPVMLRTTPERGMLMASALVAYLLVAWVSLIGITVVLWDLGLGPEVGV